MAEVEVWRTLVFVKIGKI